jgi:hypothetical protein
MIGRSILIVSHQHHTADRVGAFAHPFDGGVDLGLL